MSKPAPANHIWFIDGLAIIHVSASDGKDGISIIESCLPYGSAPPMHIHHTEDEVFEILEGEFLIRCNGQDHRLVAGDIMLAPKGVPHTYRVVSPKGARCLTTAVHGDFERFVRAVGRPAERHELPPQSGPPSPEAIQALKTTAAKFGIELVGPPLQG